MLSPPNTTTRTPAISVLSELNHAASALAVYASQPASQQTTQDSLVSWWPTFAARDWLPAGLLSRFQLFITSSLAKLSWRNVFTQYVYAAQSDAQRPELLQPENARSHGERGKPPLDEMHAEIRDPSEQIRTPLSAAWKRSSAGPSPSAS